MSKKPEPEDAVGVIDSEGTFWTKDRGGRWYTNHRGLYEVTYANINDMEVVRGPVTPLFAKPPGKAGEPTAFEEHAANLATTRLAELEKAQAEILRLETLYGAKIEGIACECTEITPGSHIEPPAYEQNPWCPVHPDVNQIRAEFAGLKDLLDKADALIMGQRAAAEAEMKYAEVTINAMESRRIYELAKEASER